jgi:hypothetical protein
MPNIPACFRCWFMWPDGHKLWPAVGYGSAEGRYASAFVLLDDLIRIGAGERGEPNAGPITGTSLDRGTVCCPRVSDSPEPA